MKNFNKLVFGSGIVALLGGCLALTCGCSKISNYFKERKLYERERNIIETRKREIERLEKYGEKPKTNFNFGDYKSYQRRPVSNCKKYEDCEDD